MAKLMAGTKLPKSGEEGVAVLFLVFNRPDTTSRVFDAIRKARPTRLYVACDGPRATRHGEDELVQRVRELATAVDWPCELRTYFRETNLGCRVAVSEAIDWFFEHEEQGIILEDDCLPSQSFFRFCEVLLKRYKNDPRIFNITGFNKQQHWKPEKWDYFFSATGGIWGWATWRRAWTCYDPEMSDLEEWSRNRYLERKLGRRFGRLRQKQLERAKRQIDAGKISSWDYQWAYTRHKHHALACVPSRNLVTNIGFGDDATHTRKLEGYPVERYEMPDDFRFNDRIKPEEAFDLRFLGHVPLGERLVRKLRRLMGC